MAEVMVGAAVLVALALATLTLVDVSGERTSSNRSRGVASNLAGADLERMRAMNVRDLSNHRRTEVKGISGVAYTVESRADWVRDASGTVGCTADSSGVDYIKIRSTVTWPAMSGVKPVVAESLVAPPVGGFGTDRGSLVVALQRASGAPAAGVSVTAGGAADATNAAGCAVFGMLPPGPAEVTFGRTGWVTPNGEESVSLTSSVVAGQTSSASWEYDQAGRIPVRFETIPEAGDAPVQAQSAGVSAAHSALVAARQFGSSGARSELTASALFPFTSAYGVYAGRCAGNDPTGYDPGYYASNPGLVTVAPGETVTPLTVRVPTMWVRVRKALAVVPGARVTVKTTESGCPATFPAVNADSSGEAHIALPFGEYELCAADALNRRVKQTVTNDAVDGMSAPVTLTIPVTALPLGCS